MNKQDGRRSFMARTPLFITLHRTLHLAHLANRPGAPPVDELVEMHHEASWTRRCFLKSSVAMTLLFGGSSLLTACSNFINKKPEGLAPRIVVVGAGIAGLNAAYKLKIGGLRASIYDANTRIGGLIYTAKDLMAPGLTTELGGEFIDSDHKEMLSLAQEFGLELLDMKNPSEASVRRHAYFFRGRFYSETEVVEAFRPIAARMQADYNSLGNVVDFEHEGGASRLDNTSLEDYLDQVGATDWFKNLLEVAYVTEYGLDADQQSSLNLLFLTSTDVSGGTFEIFGESDERYKIKGGNQQIVDELGRRLEGQIELEHRLVAIKTNGPGFKLTFDGPNGSAVDVEADFVVLCIPFSILREVDIQLDLPSYKLKTIKELGYGTNAKVLVGFTRRIWRDQGYSGYIFSDEAYQCAWDNSQGQDGIAGGLTFFSGGQPGIAVGSGTPADQANRLMPGLERAFPGSIAARNGNVARFQWPSFPLTKGSYACYKPGQWTTIHGAEIKPVGQLYFAGEHCSYDFQGYMNGGAETGKLAAESLLTILAK